MKRPRKSEEHGFCCKERASEKGDFALRLRAPRAAHECKCWLKCSQQRTLSAYNIFHQGRGMVQDPFQLGWSIEVRDSCMTSYPARNWMMVCVLKARKSCRTDEFWRSFWELEDPKISDAGDKTSAVSKVMIHMLSNITHRDRTCEVRLPSRDYFDLSVNRQAAVRRLHKLTNRLASQNGLL